MVFAMIQAYFLFNYLLFSPHFPPTEEKIFSLVLDKQAHLWHLPFPADRDRSALRHIHALDQIRCNLQNQSIMVAIRLNRQGSKDRPYYKVVVVDSHARRDGAYIEQVGTYDPMKEGVNYTLDMEKVEKWLKNGAQPSETVNSMIRKARVTSQA